MSTPYCLLEGMELGIYLTERDVPTNENVDGRTNVTSPNDSGFTTQKPIKEFDSFPEYPLLSDLETSNSLDRLETMSVATNISDDESQFVLSEAALQEEDDIFSTAGVAIAEEAELVDENIRVDKKRQRFMAKQINVLDAKLANLNVALSSSNGISKIEGFASEIQISERRGQICGEVYNESGKIPNSSKLTIKDDSYNSAKLKFEVQAEATEKRKGSIIKAQLQNLFLQLSDEVISHLGPFIQDNLQEEQPVTLEISLANSNIQIIDPKKKNPLRIKLGKIDILDGPEPNGPQA
uniref:Uncharacterized protein n=1 Tax=Acrobeloides nanus TaxID=290746 RepID=A0A914EJR7_9BILA